MEKVSVIIPTYKGTEHLKRAILSVVNQTYKNLEIIVVDDNGRGTVDNQKTKEIVTEFDCIYIEHETNRNGAAARNTGLKCSTGNFICFLDDDDIMLPERIDKCVEILKNEQKYDGVFTNVLCVHENLMPQRIVNILKKGNCFEDILLNSMFFGTGSNIFITRNAFKITGYFDEEFTRNQDIEYMLRFYRNFESTYINEILIIKAKNNTNNIPDAKKMIKVKKLLFDKFQKEIESLSISNFNSFTIQQKKELILTNSINIKIEDYKLFSFNELLIIVGGKLKIKNCIFFKMLNTIRKHFKYKKIKRNVPENIHLFLISIKDADQ